MRVPPVKIVFSKEDREEILRRIDKALANGQVAQGENVRQFEAAFARYLGIKHAVAVSSGGAALEVGMRLLGVEGREVLVPTNTFAASATGVLLANGSVKLVDVDPRTFSVSLAGLKAAVTARTAGVMVVHIGGIITPEIEDIREWCKANDLWLFEDAAHAHGSSLNGKMAGTFGRLGAYSFFSTKVMTSGEGGMLVTDDDELADRARGLRDYGKPDPWVSFHTELGSNWRMAEFCGAVGIVHLQRLPEFVAWREKIANYYTRALRDFPEFTPVLPKGKNSWYKYIVLLPPGVERDQVKQAMKALDVGLAGPVYDVPLHQQPVFKHLGGHFPVADDICQRHICLPLYFGMTLQDAEYVMESLALVVSAKEAHA